MKHCRRFLCVAVMLMCFGVSSSVSAAEAQAGSRQYGFVPNNGQWKSDVLWLGHLKNMNVWVTKTGVNFDYRVAEKIESKDKSAAAPLEVQNNVRWNILGHNVRMNVVGANGTAQKLITHPNGTHNNYFFGNDEKKWVTNVPVCDKAIITDIQKGIDLVLSIENDMPRYDFVVKPGANPKNIELKFDGTNSFKVEDGAVEYATRFGTVRNARLIAYQDNGNGVQTPVRCEFQRKGNNVSFNVGDYDKSKPLIIDPTVYATYYGTNKIDEVRRIAIDPLKGDIVVTGFTESDQFPTTTGSYQTTAGGNVEAFVSKFTADLTRVIWSTYIGGGGIDRSVAMAIDPGGNIYIAGETNSPDYPDKGLFLQSSKGQYEAFFSKISPPGDRLLASTVFGGSTDDRATDISVDNSGVAVVVGETFSNNFRLRNEDKPSKAEANRSDGFIVKFTQNATDVVFSTFFGGAENDRVNGVFIDASGLNIYITGQCGADLYKTYPTGGGPNPPTPYDAAFNQGGYDCFVARMSPNGMYNNPQVHFITYIGGTTASGIGNGTDVGKVIVPLTSGEIIVAGETTGNLFPNGMGNSHKGANDLFILKLQQNGRQLINGQYIGGPQNETVNCLAYSKETSSIWLGGNTLSTAFPNKPGVQAEQTKLMGGQEGFVYQFDVGSFESSFSRFMGGNRTDDVTGIAVTARGDAYFCGYTESTGLFSFKDSYQKTSKGAREGFIRKHSFGTVALDFPKGGPADIFCPGTFINVQFVKSAPVQAQDPFTILLSSDNGMTWPDTIGKKVVNSPYLWTIPENLSPGKYRVRIIHESGVRDESDTNFTIIPAPKIVTRPENDTICPGDSTEFHVKAEGNGITYQWYFGETKLEGETKPVLILKNVPAAKAGQYSVNIGSANCSPIKVSAMLFVKPATTITKQPTGTTTIPYNSPYTLKVKATGEKLSYQWYQDGNVLQGDTYDSLYIGAVNVSAYGKYKVVVSGTCGTSTSDEVEVRSIPSSADDGISETGNLKIAMLSPMPINEQLNCTIMSQRNCPLSVQLTDMMGRVVRVMYSGTLETLSVLPLSVNCSDLPNGTYYVSARCGAESAVMKVSIIK